MSLFNRVRMSIIEMDDIHKETLLQELKNAPTFFTVYTDKQKVSKIHHSGLTEDLFGTLLVMLSRHIGFFDFMKLLILNTELYRKDGGVEGFNFTPKALEYIEWKKRNFNQSKTNDLL
ncbi:hypothetical protein [Ferruginibacter sp.]